jgi:hypothetical protein
MGEEINNYNIQSIIKNLFVENKSIKKYLFIISSIDDFWCVNYLAPMLVN